MKLDPKALEQAKKVYDGRSQQTFRNLEAAITAYLTAIGETHVLVSNKPQAWWRPVVVGDNFRFEVTFDTPSGTNWRPLYAAAKEGE